MVKGKGATGNVPKGKSNTNAAAKKAAAKKPYNGIPAVGTGDGAPGSYQAKGKKR